VAAAGQPVAGGGLAVPVAWVPPAAPVEHFTGRAEELARLDRWAADPQVAPVGVTAWGGAGKTAKPGDRQSVNRQDRQRGS
jgi:hypothetical protein